MYFLPIYYLLGLPFPRIDSNTLIYFGYKNPYFFFLAINYLTLSLAVNLCALLDCLGLID